MTVRNLHVVRRRSNMPYNPLDTIYLSCEMLDHERNVWYRQDLTVTDETAFKRLSDWNAKYDTAESKAISAAMVKDILDNQAFYGTGF